MAHFARIDGDNRVISVIVADQEYIDSGLVGSPDQWVKYSYNMRGGVHYNPETGEPSEDQSIIDGDAARQRKNAAGVGGYYDPDADAFYSVQPFPSWTLNTTTYLWEAPTARPEGGVDEDGESYIYNWDEEQLAWVHSVTNEVYTP